MNIVRAGCTLVDVGIMLYGIAMLLPALLSSGFTVGPLSVMLALLRGSASLSSASAWSSPRKACRAADIACKEGAVWHEDRKLY